MPNLEPVAGRGLLTLLLLGAAAATPAAIRAAESAPVAMYINAKAVQERFQEITAEDMEMLRGKKILVSSRSFGMNLCHGLILLAGKDKKYALPWQRYDVFKAGGDLSVIPNDAFEKCHFVHYLCSLFPATKRLDEVHALLKDPAHNFGQTVDAVMVLYEYFVPQMADYYVPKMDAMQAEFPHIRFIYVAGGFINDLKPDYQAKTNEPGFQCNEKVLPLIKGKVPVYDLGAILSDDYRVGHRQCPEYTSDPASLHPNLPEGEMAMAKGFLLALRDAFRQAPHAPKAAAGAAPVQAPQVETLAPSHPDLKAVRAILDANGLTRRTVESCIKVEGGRVVALYLHENGVTEIPEAIGQLDGLRTLHVYGDRRLPHPLLKKISPAIGRCAQLEELQLAHNDLTALPVEIARLEKIKTLTLGDNRLKNLPPEVERWATRFDPQGLAEQNLGGK